MIDIKQIASFYPENLRIFKKNLLREYLQYKILEIIFNSKFSDNLIFIGGTAIHMIYQNERFSEDLDFDNLNLTEKKFAELSGIIKRKLSSEGYEIEMENSFKQAYICHLKFLNLLYESNLSNHKNEKLLIQLDTEYQKIKYIPDKKIINKFDVFTQINVAPPDILLSQKICAIFNRKRAMGRDFYDSIFLFGRTKPNFDYLKKNLNISNEKELKNRLLLKCNKLNFNLLAKDLEPFLFNPDSSSKIKLFVEYIKET